MEGNNTEERETSADERVTSVKSKTEEDVTSVTSKTEEDGYANGNSEQPLESSDATATNDGDDGEMDINSFRRLAIGLLFLQALATVIFSWHAWRIQNVFSVTCVFGILHLWFAITTWKATMAHSKNINLFRASVLLGAIAGNPIFMMNTDYVLVNLAIGVGFNVSCWLSAEITAKSWRKVVTCQKQRNEIACRSLEISLKSGLVVIYLVSQAIAGIGGKSSADVDEAYAILRLEEESVNATEYSSAQEIHQNTTEANKALLSGATMNLFIVISFVLLHVAQISLSDVAKLRFTITETITAISALLMLLLTLIRLGILSTYTGGDEFQYSSAVKGSIWFLIVIFGIFGVIGSAFLSRKISKSEHPYYPARAARSAFSTIQEVFP